MCYVGSMFPAKLPVMVVRHGEHALTRNNLPIHRTLGSAMRLAAALRSWSIVLLVGLVSSLIPPTIPSAVAAPQPPPLVTPVAATPRHDSRVPPPSVVPALLSVTQSAQRAAHTRRGVAAKAQSGLRLAFRPVTGTGRVADGFTTSGAGWQATFAPTTVTLSLSAATASAPVRSGKAARFLPAPTPDPVGPPAAPTTVTIRFDHAQAHRLIEGVGRLPKDTRVFPDPTAVGVPTTMYARLRYRALYPGITLTYQDAHGQLKSVYTVAPGAQSTQIRWRYEGAGAVTLDARTGNLQLAPLAPTTTDPLLVQHAPVAWQQTAHGRVPVAVRTFCLTPSPLCGLEII